MQMRTHVFKQTYPSIFKLLELIVADNDLHFKDYLLSNVDIDLTALENQATLLSSNEKVIMAVGERQDQEGLVNRLNLQLLDGFLDSVFDGELSDEVWK